MRFGRTDGGTVGRVDANAVIYRHAGRKIGVGGNHVFDKRVVVEAEQQRVTHALARAVEAFA